MKLNPFSQKVVDETFALYKDGGDKVPDKFSGDVIIHMYPAHDTADAKGNLAGYYQNRFFKMIVFDIKNMKMYKPERWFDAIFTQGVNITSTTIFKDGATCIKIEGGAKFLDGQACTFYNDRR